MEKTLSRILTSYGMPPEESSALAFGTGLINHTWKISHGDRSYILQRINDHVFRRPVDIGFNIDLIGDHLATHQPGYHFVRPINTRDGHSMLFIEGEGYFRLFPFIVGSHTIDVVTTPAQAYEAAIQFGKFTRLLSGFDATLLRLSLPDFHNLSLRFRQFQASVDKANDERKANASSLIAFLSSRQPIVDQYEDILRNPNFRVRVTHHDTKISNVLFDEEDHGLCVIDLDTVMPGYFISDVGDMMRTYLCPVSEEEADFEKIDIREEYFTAIRKGYLSEMQGELTEQEKGYFVYAGKFMIYMQALRFLADYLNNDTYYGQRYEGHNLVRAGNQATLLQRLEEKEKMLTS